MITVCLLLIMFIRPPDITVIFYFVSYTLSSLNRTKPYLATWSEVSVIWKCMSKIWRIPSPYKSGPKKHLKLKIYTHLH